MIRFAISSRGDSFGAFVERAHFLNTLEDEAMADIIQFPRRLKVFDPDLTAIERAQQN